jgi:hypothetical protein
MSIGTKVRGRGGLVDGRSIVLSDSVALGSKHERIGSGNNCRIVSP